MQLFSLDAKFVSSQGVCQFTELNSTEERLVLLKGKNNAESHRSNFRRRSRTACGQQVAYSTAAEHSGTSGEKH